jgi:hypothetical protein
LPKDAGVAAEVDEFSDKETDSCPQGVLTALEPHLPSGVVGELGSLWDARNRIIHVRDTQIDRSADARKLLNGFRWAIALLSNARYFGAPGASDRSDGLHPGVVAGLG